MLMRFIQFSMLLVLLISCSKQDEFVEKVNTPILQLDLKEVEFLLSGMSLEEKVGQLLILNSKDSSQENTDSILNWASQNKLSGLIFENIDLNKYASLHQKCKRLSKKQVLFGSTQLTNLINQFEEDLEFPMASTISALQNDSIKQISKSIFHQQLMELSIDFLLGPNFDPYQDSNTTYNQDLPAVEKRLQHQYAQRFVRDKNRLGVICVAETSNDKIGVELDSMATAQKQSLADLNYNLDGLQAMKVDAEVFQFDTLVDRPMDYIKIGLSEDYNFDGLVFTEVENTSTIHNALYGGADFLVINKELPKYFNIILDLYRSGVLPIESLNDKVARIIKVKEWIASNKKKRYVNKTRSKELLNAERYPQFINDIYENSSLANYSSRNLPLTYLRNRNINVHCFSKDSLKVFKSACEKFKDLKFQWYETDHKSPTEPVRFGEAKSNIHIIVLDQLNLDPQFDLPFVHAINQQKDLSKIIVINFGNPRNLELFQKRISFVQLFEHNAFNENLAAEILFGSNYARGTYPLKPRRSNNFASKQIRLKQVSPEEINIDSEKLLAIDSIIQEAISQEAIPGAQVLAIKGGNVFYDKCFGYHTYDKKQEVQKDDIYDLASVSKVAATSLAVMKLYDQGKVNLNEKLRDCKALSETAKSRFVSISNLLLHRSNLQPNMPIYDFVTISDSIYQSCSEIYCQKKRTSNDIKIAKDFYMNSKYVDSLWIEVEKIKPYKKSKYRYSDVNFNLLQKVIEKKSNKGLDQFVKQHFYDDLGLKSTMYNPLTKFKPEQIVPTEHDTKWRRQLLRGYVHDEYAAMQNGVAGSAGLFSNASELGTLFQMLLNGGEYGGVKYIKPETVNLFTSAPWGNKRGLGFDKPRGKYTESCSSKASPNSFGHSGFTGTCVWVDPENEMIFIFLSNRIHPSINNRKLFQDKYRGRIHTVLYDALDTYEKNAPGQTNKISEISASKAPSSDALSLIDNN